MQDMTLHEFLGSDLSRLEKRYHEIFTSRYIWTDEDEIHNPNLDELDKQIHEWAARYQITDDIAAILRAQPLENAKQVLDSVAAGMEEFPPNTPIEKLLQRLSSEPIPWLSTLDAMRALVYWQEPIQAFKTLCDNWGVQIASQWLHTLMPHEYFPLSAELHNRFDRLTRYLNGLQIGIEWPEADIGATLLWMEISDGVCAWAHEQELESWQVWAIFEHYAPSAFPDPEPKKRIPSVWISTSSTVSFEALDDDLLETVMWTCNSKVRKGDIILIYCMRPHSSITHRFRALCDAFENPLAYRWTRENSWAELGEKQALPWIAYKDMNDDEVLKSWSVVRTRFLSASRASVPPEMWQRLQELIEEKIDEFDPETKVTTSKEGDGTKESKGSSPTEKDKELKLLEREFEESVVKPLLIRLGWDLSKHVVQQEQIPMALGSMSITGRADFVLYDEESHQQAVAVVEVKRSIPDERSLLRAVFQAESYSGRKRVERFALVAREGLWVYRMCYPGHSELLATFALDSLEDGDQFDKVQELLGARQYVGV